MKSLLLAALIVAVVPLSSAAEEQHNWYIKTGVGLDRVSDLVFSDKDCSSETPVALYGCGTGGDGFPYRSIGSLGTTRTVNLGIGRNIASQARFEVQLNSRPWLNFQGYTNFLDPGQQQSVALDLSSRTGLLAVYADFPRLDLGTRGRLLPFLGAGIGVARYRTSETLMTFPRTTTTVPGDKGTEVFWMVTVGTGIPLTQDTTLELAWRYSDFGAVHTGGGEGQVVWQDGGRDPLSLNLAATRAKMNGHTLGLAVRFSNSK